MKYVLKLLKIEQDLDHLEFYMYHFRKILPNQLRKKYDEFRLEVGKFQGTAHYVLINEEDKNPNIRKIR